MRKLLKAAAAAVIVLAAPSVWAQSDSTRILEIQTPDGQTIRIEIPDTKGRYSLQDEAKLQKDIMKRTIYRSFREAKCESYQVTLINFVKMLDPIEVPQERTPVRLSGDFITESAQAYVDTFEDARLQSFMVGEINTALRDPDAFKRRASNGEWKQTCYEFMVENYFPEAAAKFGF